MANYFENGSENSHSVKDKMLLDKLSNYQFLRETRHALRTDSFVLECCGRLLHQNKLAALSDHQITCLLSIMGLNYGGR
jgi:hypothetical protein